MLFPPSNILAGSEGATSDLNIVGCVFQGVVGACGITVLCHLSRIHMFLRSHRESGSGSEHQRGRRTFAAGKPLVEQWRTVFQLWSLTFLLSLVGPRVSSLIVLEFSFRAMSSRLTAGPDSPSKGPQLLLLQSQFSLGCALTSTLSFLQQGALHSSLNLMLAAGLGWALAGVCHNLWMHVVKLYPLHSTERYCGKCITLLTSGHSILPSLQRGVTLAFAIAAVASTATVYEHFLSQNDAVKFWTPLTLCYAMLVFYVQEEQNRHSGAGALLHSVVLRLGALTVLMLAVGRWSDVLHVLMAFLGEAVCLLPARDLIQAFSKEEDDISCEQNQDSSSRLSTKQNTSAMQPDGSQIQN